MNFVIPISFILLGELLPFLIVIKTLPARSEEAPVDRTPELLNNLRLTHLNDLDENVTCPRHHFITGLRIRTETKDPSSGPKDGDSQFPAYNGFEIICSDGMHRNSATRRKIVFGKNGDWNVSSECKIGFAIGLSTELTPYLSSSPSRILNMKLQCSENPQSYLSNMSRDTGSLLHHVLLTSNSTNRETMQFCEMGSAMVGLGIRADSVITIIRGDVSSITDLGITCEEVVNPVNTCNLRFHWEKVRGMKCKNSTDNKLSKGSKKLQVQCMFETWTGIGPNDRLRNSERIFKAFETMGITNDKAYIMLLMLKKVGSPEATNWLMENLSNYPVVLDRPDQSSLWKSIYNAVETIEFSNSTLSPLKMLTKLNKTASALQYSPTVEQLVGYCGIMKVAFNRFNSRVNVYFEHSIRKRKTRIVFED